MKGDISLAFEADDRGSSNSPCDALILRTISPNQWRGTSLDIDFSPEKMHTGRYCILMPKTLRRTPVIGQSS